MFDIGGMELLLIFIIILVVAGPERLPGIIKTIGRWTGYARRTVNQFKRDFEDEFEVAELRKEIKASTQMEELSSLQSDLKNIGKDLDKELDDAEKSFKTIQDDAKTSLKTRIKAVTQGQLNRLPLPLMICPSRHAIQGKN